MTKGYTQTLGIDFEETFSPVADIRAIRILIDIAAFYDNEIWQMDVKTAFLNGYLSEEVYMEQPEGFVNLKYPNRVCKLKRSIHGLKQASRQWNKWICDEIRYLDSLENVMSHAFKNPTLGRCFAMKDLGASTPAEVKRMQNVPYASAVGSIMYAVRCTRPDVAFAQNITSYSNESRVSCYTDAGYLTDDDDLKSQTGYKAEYIAAYDASKEAVWVRKFISGLGVVPTIEEPIIHYLREVIEFGDIKLEKVHTDDNLADPFTKALAFPKHSEHTKNIGMLPASSLM
ncbi:retrotransposon protein, putative, ty1-copia subclass [Tanacetum coccineum]